MESTHHHHGLDDLNITVVGPDDQPSSSMSVPIGIYKQNGGQTLDHDTFSFSSSEPQLDYTGSHDGSSSGGHSTPITPFSAFLDLTNFDNGGNLSQGNVDTVGFDSFDNQLAPPGTTFSPTSLSPSFGGLSLSDNGTYPTDSTIMFNSNAMSSKDHSTANNATAYGPYSPLLEQGVFNSTTARANLHVSIPTQPSNVDNSNNNGTFPDMDAIFNFDSNVGSQDLLSPDSGLTTPFDMLNMNNPRFHSTDNHRLGRQHNRGLSVSGTSWTPSSSALTSPSLSYTPTDYQSTSGLAPRSPYLSPDHDLDQVILADGGVSVQRRHSSHVGHGHGRASSTSHRGRSASRASPSATSSRRTSPYPSPRLEGGSGTLDPSQIWSDNNNTHLSVPGLDALGGVVGGLSRRHSFTTPGTAYRGHQQQGQFHQHQHHDGTVSASALHEFQVSASSPSPSPSSHSPISSSPSGTSPIRQVASSAGIKAAEARRTKEARFSCDICGQTFTTNHNLKNHKNVHFGVKEHQCSSCTRNFTTQSVLARHLKTCKVANAVAAAS